MPAAETTVPPDNETPATTPILLQSLQLSNVLSFGPNTPALELNALNILVGANGSGKSNFIDAIDLLRSTPSDIGKVIRDGGGVQEWIWKGNQTGYAGIEAVTIDKYKSQHLHHMFFFDNTSQRYRFIGEVIKDIAPAIKGEPYTVYYPTPADVTKEDTAYYTQHPDGLLRSEESSALRTLRDPINRPELAYLADQYERVRIYRDWQFGRNSPVHKYADASLPQATLAEDFSNLALFLNRLCRDPKTKKTLFSHLHNLYQGIDDIRFDVVGGFIQLYFTEGDYIIPAKRLSDGTLHYLCLLAILCDPKPPPLICIEEPELGLHPDLLHKIADLLLDASTRTQLIVTTHSHIIVDAMTETPEAIIVCEKRDGQTSLERLNGDDLQIWLDKYRLGELWSSGELGGTRW